METTINGRPMTFEPHPLDTAIDVIRDQAGLTGTKLACGGGVCGACTVLVDDLPTCSCLMPANHMAGKEIQTIEAHNRDNLLTPFRRDRVRICLKKLNFLCGGWRFAG